MECVMRELRTIGDTLESSEFWNMDHMEADSEMSRSRIAPVNHTIPSD